MISSDHLSKLDKDLSSIIDKDMIPLNNATISCKISLKKMTSLTKLKRKKKMCNKNKKNKLIT